MSGKSGIDAADVSAEVSAGAVGEGALVMGAEDWVYVAAGYLVLGVLAWFGFWHGGVP